MDGPPKSLVGRLGWLVLIWTLSVAALATVAWLIRLVLL